VGNVDQTDVSILMTKVDSIEDKLDAIFSYIKKQQDERVKTEGRLSTLESEIETQRKLNEKLSNRIDWIIRTGWALGGLGIILGALLKIL